MIGSESSPNESASRLLYSLYIKIEQECMHVRVRADWPAQHSLTHAHTDDENDGVRFVYFQALMAPACHENMVKVGGYILGEFGNLIAGDARSS